jgi:hypothetical protein
VEERYRKKKLIGITLDLEHKMMGISFKKYAEKQSVKEKSRIEKRVEALPTGELLPWTENALYTIGRNLSSWQKTKDAATLEEARVGAEALHVILESLVKRHANG